MSVDRARGEGICLREGSHGWVWALAPVGTHEGIDEVSKEGGTFAELIMIYEFFTISG